MFAKQWAIGCVLAVALPAQLLGQPATQPVEAPATQPALVASTQPATRPAREAPATQPAFAALGDPEDLLARLADPDWRIRRKTEDRLIRAGEEAKPFIQDLIRRAPTDEARKNAQAALAAIDENRLLGTSFITLHVHDAIGPDVFQELARQAFAPITPEPSNLWEQGSFPHVTLDIDHQPFWKVAPQICQTLGVTLRSGPSGMHVTRGGPALAEGITRVQGPFLVVANQIAYTRTRWFGTNQNQTSFGMNVTLIPEPKLTILRSGGMMIDVQQAIDDHGNSLLPVASRNRAMWGGGFSNFGGWNLYAPLEYPTRNPGNKITRFKGNTRFVIQLESQKIEIPTLMSLTPTARRIQGMQVNFLDMKKAGDAWQLRIRVDQGNLGGPDWQQLMEGLQNRLQVLDAQGNALDHRGMSTTANPTTIEITLDFGRSVSSDGHPSSDPFRLVWEVPTKTRELEVPIEFTDLPLFDEK